jgi:hypothetical protein
VSNETLASHDYTGMWKLTLLCGCVQLLGKSNRMECAASQCSMCIHLLWIGIEWCIVLCYVVEYIAMNRIVLQCGVLY